MRNRHFGGVLAFGLLSWSGSSMACSPPNSVSDDEVRKIAEQHVAGSDAIIDARISSYDHHSGRVVLEPLRVLKGSVKTKLRASTSMCGGSFPADKGTALRVLLIHFSNNEWGIINPPYSSSHHVYDDAIDKVLGEERPLNFGHYPMNPPPITLLNPVPQPLPPYSPSAALRSSLQAYRTCVIAAARVNAKHSTETPVVVARSVQQCIREMEQVGIERDDEIASLPQRAPDRIQVVNNFVNGETAAAEAEAFAATYDGRHPQSSGR